MRRNQGIVAIGLTASLATAWMIGNAVTSSGPSHVRVCQDPDTGNRLEDRECESRSSGTYYRRPPRWYYMNVDSRGTSVPGVGSRLPPGGSEVAPSSGKVTSADSKGGTVSRGGFGSTAGGKGS